MPRPEGHGDTDTAAACVARAHSPVSGCALCSTERLGEFPDFGSLSQEYIKQKKLLALYQEVDTVALGVLDNVASIISTAARTRPASFVAARRIRAHAPHARRASEPGHDNDAEEQRANARPCPMPSPSFPRCL